MKANILNNIHPDPAGYAQIAKLYDDNKDKFFEVVPIRVLNWFDADMAAPLGAVLDLLEDNLNDVVFESIDNKVRNILQRNDFLSYFGFPHQNDGYGTTIKYKKMKPEDGRYFQGYVANMLLNRPELPNMSDSLSKKMIEAIFELFVNAQIHSKTKHIYTCGQFFPRRHTVELCIADRGVGFKNKFLKRFGKSISAVDAILWAIEDKNTTKVGVPGGIGLALLSEFVQLNKGRLQIISDDGFYQYDCSGVQTEKLEIQFPGTVVSVLFRTNDTHNYSLVSDKNETSIF